MTDLMIMRIVQILERATMKFFDQPMPIGIGPVSNASVYILFSLGLFFACCQTSAGQNWPVNQPDTGAVPQYTPRYPLQPSGAAVPQENSPPPIAPPVESTPTPKALNRPARQSTDLQLARPLIPQPEVPSAAMDRSIYRDRDPLPVDPRKPCNPCVRPEKTLPRCCCDLPGLRGRPYMDKEPGGCLCGKKKQPKHPQFSVDWPRPFSACLDDHFPGKAAQRYEPCQKKRCLDVFDSLETFKLINYQRKDNGYCGRGSDPYGCLGESRYRSRVAGINDNVLRVPSDRNPGF
jgi:hypothetical protein